MLICVYGGSTALIPILPRLTVGTIMIKDLKKMICIGRIHKSFTYRYRAADVSWFLSVIPS